MPKVGNFVIFMGIEVESLTSLVFFLQYFFSRFVLLLEFLVYVLSEEWTQNKKIRHFFQIIKLVANPYISRRQLKFDKISKSYMKLKEKYLPHFLI